MDEYKYFGFLKFLNDPKADTVDEDAEKKLWRFSIGGLLIFQLLVAALLLIDLRWGRGSFTCFVMPILLTLWVACRLRYYPHVTWINPFSVGIFSVAIGQGIQLLSGGNNMEFGEAIIFHVITSLSFGLFLGFVCVLFADPIMAIKNRLQAPVEVDDQDALTVGNELRDKTPDPT